MNITTKRGEHLGYDSHSWEPLMGNDDPTTTVPGVTGAASGNHLVMILVLTLIAAALSPVAIRVFYRSLRPQAGQAAKATAGVLCAVLAIDLAIIVATVGNPLLVVPLALLAAAAAGYTVPAVRKAAVDMFHHQAKVPPEPPGPVAHV